MVERKLFKTKLCVLYQKGHCPRQTCSFAHGDAELRRFSGSFNGRRDYRDSDLRGKLGRRRSPPRRYSPGRDIRSQDTSHGYSPPRPIGSRSDRKRKKKQQSDSQSDFSGSLKISDETEDQVKNKKPKSSESKGILDDQLRHVHSEINILDDHKHKLKVYLEGRVEEADSLTSRIQELEMQLGKEKEECKRISSKIKKFIKAHNRHSRIQDELKRSQTRLQKLGAKLGSDATRPGATEEDASINILSDEETFDNHVLSPRNELQKNASPIKKRLQIHPVEANEESKQENPTKGEGFVSEAIRLEKLSRWDVHRAQFNNNKEPEAKSNVNNGYRPLANQDKSKLGKLSTNFPLADKLKGSEPGLVLPSTSMAAHAVEEVVEVVEMDKKFELADNASMRVQKGVANEIFKFPFPLPPPPPIPQKAYLQYEGDNENVDVDGLDGLDEEAVDVDII